MCGLGSNVVFWQWLINGPAERGVGGCKTAAMFVCMSLYFWCYMWFHKFHRSHICNTSYMSLYICGFCMLKRFCMCTQFHSYDCRQHVTKSVICFPLVVFPLHLWLPLPTRFMSYMSRCMCGLQHVTIDCMERWRDFVVYRVSGVESDRAALRVTVVSLNHHLLQTSCFRYRTNGGKKRILRYHFVMETRSDKS